LWAWLTWWAIHLCILGQSPTTTETCHPKQRSTSQSEPSDEIN
jgi:hypothetical protein